MGKEEVRFRLISKHARAHGLPFIYANQVGGNDELISVRSSTLFDTVAVYLAFRQDFCRLERLGIQARAEVRHGLVVDEILAEARRGNYDLVVIGAYRGEGWQRILLDDLAHRLIVQLDRPVLIVR